MPFDRVKTMIQVEVENPPTIRVAARKIWNSNGVRGFYVGLQSTLLRAFPANAALFVGYEYTKRLILH
jgi:hypothetical protein